MKQKKTNLDNCRICGSSSMEMLYSFGGIPVAGYLDNSRADALKAERINCSISFCNDCGFVQQSNLAAKAILIEKVYANYQSTYTNSKQVSVYMVDFLGRAITSANIAKGDTIMEIGSNDSSILDYLSREGFSVVGFDPCVSEDVIQGGYHIIGDYFNKNSAKAFVENHTKVKLIFSRHTLEHAFEPLDFLESIDIALASDGIAVIEIPYLEHQVANNQFQSFTFQHISFFSVTSFSKAIEHLNLKLFDIQFSKMDAGSMVLFLKKEPLSKREEKRINSILSFEKMAELNTAENIKKFFSSYQKQKEWLNTYLVNCKREGKRIAAYGAGSKGQAMVNMLDLDYHLLEYIFDHTPSNRGKFVPGTGNEILQPSKENLAKFDICLIAAPTHIQEIISKERNNFFGLFIKTLPTISLNSTL